YFGQVCARGWEGLIAKRADAPYARGRTKDWLKFKCEAGRERGGVAGTERGGSGGASGRWLRAAFERSGGSVELVYAGKVGTGFSQPVLRDLHARVTPLEVQRSPCTRGKLPSVGVHWVRPELVAQVAFTEWTSANQLRHPRFQGLRTDKDARDVVREDR